MPVLRIEEFAGLKTCWVGDSSLRVRQTDRAPGLLRIEKDSQSVVLTPGEAKALALALLQQVGT